MHNLTQWTNLPVLDEEKEPPVHVVIINGSQRRRPGFTADLLSRFAEGVRDAGGTTDTFDLAALGIKPCIACEACQKSGRGQCVVNTGDGAELVFEGMRKADVVVYGSPIYVFFFSSLLKSLLERFYGIGRESGFLVSEGGLLFHETDRTVCGKPFVVVLTSDNSENETPANAVRYFRSFARFLDAPLLGCLVRGGGRLIRSGKGDTSLEEVRNLYRRAGSELVREGRVSHRTERQAGRSAIPAPASLIRILKMTKTGRKVLVAKAAGW